MWWNSFTKFSKIVLENRPQESCQELGKNSSLNESLRKKRSFDPPWASLETTFSIILQGQQGDSTFRTTIPKILWAHHVVAFPRAPPHFPSSLSVFARRGTRSWKNRPRWASAISSALGLCNFCRASNSAMLGQSVRRFTTSVVRRSHYEEGPGKVSVYRTPGSLGRGHLAATWETPKAAYGPCRGRR